MRHVPQARIEPAPARNQQEIGAAVDQFLGAVFHQPPRQPLLAVFRVRAHAPHAARPDLAVIHMDPVMKRIDLRHQLAVMGDDTHPPLPRRHVPGKHPRLVLKLLPAKAKAHELFRGDHFVHPHGPRPIELRSVKSPSLLPPSVPPRATSSHAYVRISGAPTESWCYPGRTPPCRNSSAHSPSTPARNTAPPSSSAAGRFACETYTDASPTAPAIR